MLRCACLPSLRSPSLNTEAAGTAPPDAFGPFRVLHQIGAGTLGPVFRAYDPDRERLVAIKLFKLDLPPQRVHQLVAAFEALIAADLTHPALVAPLATGISGVSAFLVQEYVGAESLDLAVREYGPAPAVDAVRVAAQLGGALDFAAAASIVHGALHPRDILLSTDDTRMTGLGVARALAQAGVTAPVRRPYTPPERIDGGDWDRRADIFSLAALIFELLSGRRIAGTGAEAVDSLGEVTGADGRALRVAFARALAGNPAARFSSALEFVEALQHACVDQPAAPVVAAAPPLRKRAARTAVEKAAVPGTEARQEIEPELPLAAPIVEDARIGPAPVAAGPTVSDIELHRAEEARYAEVDEAPAIVPIVSEPPHAAAEDPIAYSPPTGMPAGFITGDPDPLSTLDRTRSAVWPLVVALGIGAAVGFASGYFTGAQQTRSAPIAAAVPAGKEFTESAVPAATEQSQVASRQSQVESPKPQVDSPKAQGEAATSQPGTANGETRTTSGEPHLSHLRPQIRDGGETTRRTTKAEPRTPAPVSTPGRLLIRSTPAGATVTVDGKDYGRTPATVRELSIGPHEVRVARAGYAPADRRVVLTRSRSAQSMTVTLDEGSRGAVGSLGSRGSAVAASSAFAGALTVDSRPAGAKAFLDGKLVGSTPLSLQTVAAGEHAIRLEREGYRRWSSTIRVVASEQNRVTASLER